MLLSLLLFPSQENKKLPSLKQGRECSRGTTLIMTEKFHHLSDCFNGASRQDFTLLSGLAFPYPSSWNSFSHGIPLYLSNVLVRMDCNVLRSFFELMYVAIMLRLYATESPLSMFDEMSGKMSQSHLHDSKYRYSQNQADHTRNLSTNQQSQNDEDWVDMQTLSDN